MLARNLMRTGGRSATGTQLTYDAKKAQAPESGPKRIAYLVRLGTLAYWVPAIGIDLMVLLRSHFSTEAMSFVFWLMFREAIVFLTLWFGFGAVQALLFGRARREARRRMRWDKPSTTVLVPNREHKAH